MAIISIPFTFTVGATIVASQHNSNFSTIYSDYNGNVIDSNVAANAAIAYTKLSLVNSVRNTDILSTSVFATGNLGTGTANNTTFLRGDGSWNNPFAYVKVSNTQSSGVSGGTATSGAFNTCILNTKDFDTTSIGSLATNQITLPAGTYMVRGRQVFFQTNLCQVRLQNITASTTLLTGESQSANSGDSTTTASQLSGQITLSVSSALSLQYQVSSTKATTGLGTATSFGPEVYAILEFTKII